MKPAKYRPSIEQGAHVSNRWDSAFLVNLAIGITLAEWLALALYHRFTGRGLPPEAYALNLLSGLCLMMALRCALQGEAWWWGAGFLAASGAAHVTYLRRRRQCQSAVATAQAPSLPTSHRSLQAPDLAAQTR